MSFGLRVTGLGLRDSVRKLEAFCYSEKTLNLQF